MPLVNLICQKGDYRVIKNPKPVFVNTENAMQKWQQIIKDLVKGLSWNGFMIAGGSLWRCISNNMTTKTDLDFFVFGENSGKRADSAMELLTHFAKFNGTIFKVNRSVIDVVIPNHRPVQIVCTNMKSAEKVLENFDLSHLQLAWMGGSIQATEKCQWSIQNGNTILCNETVVYRIDKAAKHGLNILYSEEQKFADEYSVMHPMSLYTIHNPLPEIFANGKSIVSDPIVSVALALRKVELDGNFIRPIGYRAQKFPLNWEYLDSTKLSFHTHISRKNESWKINYIDYNSSELKLITCPLIIRFIDLREPIFAVCEITEPRFKNLINQILSMVINKKIKETTYPFKKETDMTFKCSFAKKFNLTVGDTCNAIISIKCSEHKQQRDNISANWKITVLNIIDEQEIELVEKKVAPCKTSDNECEKVKAIPRKKTVPISDTDSSDSDKELEDEKVGPSKKTVMQITDTDSSDSDKESEDEKVGPSKKTVMPITDPDSSDSD
jgi:hypothetical protein